uniref:C2 domain-containing protein n=1 Tax=Aureoumbra lagunensis TaxID=44058 RepID=A0A7S3JR17_9STRA
MGRILKVTVVEAKDLVQIEKDGSDCFAEIKFVDLMNRPTNEQGKTKVKSGTVNPVWDEEFEFGQKYDMTRDDHLPRMRIRVYDYNAFTKNICIGVINFDLEKLVRAPLESLGPGGELDKWFLLKKDKETKRGVSGKIHLKLRFLSDEESGHSSLADHSDFDFKGKCGVEIEEVTEGDMPQNELWIRVVRARNLRVMDARDFMTGSGGSSDPVATIKVAGVKAETRVIKKTLEPIWNEEFRFIVFDPDDFVDILIEDQDPLSRDFMGKFTIRLDTLYNDKSKVYLAWHKLKDKNGHSTASGLGEVEIQMQWIFNPTVAATSGKGGLKKNLTGSYFTNLFGSGGDDDITDDDDDDEKEALDNDPQSKEEADKKAQEINEAQERLKAELHEIEVKSGDYQVIVDIIEARELKPKNWSGTSDPVCVIECFGEKRTSSVHNDCLSCVFDETFIINKRNLDKDIFKESSIKISVNDARPPGIGVIVRDTLIGSYVVDASYVYYQKNHELYRVWVALINDRDPEDQAIQGYLKLSVQVIGPGDRVVVHDESEARQKEKKEDMRADGGISGMVIMPPAMKREIKWLVTTIWRAEYLPIMDAAVGNIMQGGIDAFVQMEFGDIKPLRTKTKTVKGDRDKLAPEWRTELWIPITVPTGTQTVKYTVYDYNTAGPNQLVATFYTRFGLIAKLPGRHRPPHWCNLYGAALGTGASISDFGLRYGTNWTQHYNNFPDHASTYKGRILVEQHVYNRDQLPEKYRSGNHAVGINPFKRKVKRKDRKHEPPKQRYRLECIAICGSELPTFSSRNIHNIGGNSRMQLMVSWGRYSTISQSKPNNNGATEWFQHLDSIEEEYPHDVDQCPDVFVYLSKAEGNSVRPPCSFYRCSTKMLMERGFGYGPVWITLREDLSLDQLSEGIYPGSVLLQIGMGYPDEWEKYQAKWEQNLKHMTHRTPFQLRCHLFQARHLTATEADGTLDAYLAVSFSGLDPQPTEVQRETTDPTFYKTIVLDCALPTLHYAPLVFISVKDYSTDRCLGRFGVNLATDAIVSRVNSDGTKIRISPPLGPDEEEPDEKFPMPRWYDLMREEVGDTEGQVLASFELLAKTTPDQQLSDPTSLEPSTRPAVVDIVALGLRGLVPYQQMSIQLPYTKFVLPKTGGDTDTATTNRSKKPTPADPNYLQHIRMDVEIPEKPIFASPIHITVRDVRLGGFIEPVIGTGTIYLDDKIPWSPTFKKSTKFSQEWSLDDLNSAAAPLTANTDDAEPLSESPATEAGVSETKHDETIPTEISASADTPTIMEASTTITTTEAAVEAPTAQLEYLVKKQTPVEADTGAGVFGALLHVNKNELAGARKTKHRKKGLVSRLLGGDEEDDFSDLISGDDDYEEAEPEWRKDRPILKSELEETLPDSPFETYDLSLGSKVGTLLRDPDWRITGKFKGIVRVFRKDPITKEVLDDDQDDIDLMRLLKPQGYKIRLYVIRGVHLTPMDPGLMGAPGKSDPYLRIDLGKNQVFNDRENYIPDAVDVDLYKVIEMSTELPGDSQLKIDVVDYDDIGFSDDLIGTTIVDLEDRWFSRAWRKLGKDKRNETLGSMRFDVKPLELRRLFTKTSAQEQGQLECWVDILTPAEASTFPPDDVSLPPKLKAEVRVVVWKARDMVNMDTITNMNDLYIKCQMEDTEAQCTDIHWRAKGGKGSFNWRMKFDVELGHNTKVMRFPHLKIQAWDQDIIKWNDMIAEAGIDLGRYLRKCYHKRQAVKLFEGMGGISKVGGGSKKQAKANDPTKKGGLEIDEIVGQGMDGEEEDPLNPAAVPTPKEDKDKKLLQKRRAELNAREERERARQNKKKNKKKNIQDDGKKKAQCGYCWKALAGCWYCCCAGRGKEVEATGADTKEEQSKDLEDQDTEAFIQQFKEMTGWGDTDPKDSSWLYLYRFDHETGTNEYMGRICMSITIMPKSIADIQPAGFGRSEPNQHPYLSPPTGRLYFSLVRFLFFINIFLMKT